MINYLLAIICAFTLLISNEQSALSFTNQRDFLEVNSKTPTKFDNTLVLNPYKVNPLCALLSFETEKKESVMIKVIGQDGQASDIVYHFKELKYNHQIPILGLYPDYLNRVEVTTYNKRGKITSKETIEIKTAPLKTKFNKPVEIITNNLPVDDNGLYMDITSRVAFDKFGKIRWILDLKNDRIQIFRKTRDGKNLIGLYGFQDTPSVFVYSMLGEKLEAFPYPNGYVGRHDVRELENGDFIVAATDEPGKEGKGAGAEDLVLLIDRETKEVNKIWDYNTIIDNTRKHTFGKKMEKDWLHMNCVFFDEKDNALIISGRHQNSVVKIDAVTNEIKWILGPHYGWKQEFKKYLLEPLNFEQDEFNWAQHSSLILPNGNVLLFNNGNFRSYKKDAINKTYSTACEYEIDEEKMTVKLVWQYGKDRNIFTGARGDVDYNEENGNRIIAFMAISEPSNTPLIIEMDKEDNILFEAIFDRGNKYYRVEKIKLYE